MSTQSQRHGAILMRSGSVLSVGINTFRNHPDNVTDPKREASIHAEIAALRAYGMREDLRGTRLYVARINRAGQSMYSRPCANCQAVLDSLGVIAIWT